MYQFLCIFGPAAISYLTMHECLRQSADNWYKALIELLLFGAVDVAATLLLMIPFDQAGLLTLSDGSRALYYSIFAFGCSLFVGFATGVIAALARGRLALRTVTELRAKGEEK